MTRCSSIRRSPSRRPWRRPPGSGSRSRAAACSRSSRRPSAPGALGVELEADDAVASRRCSRIGRRARSRRRRCPGRRARARTSGRSRRERPSGTPSRTGWSRASSSWFQPMCGRRRRIRRWRTTVPASRPSIAALVLVGALEQQLEPEADADVPGPAAHGSTDRRPTRPCAVAAAPSPGRWRRRRARRSTSAPSQVVRARRELSARRPAAPARCGCSRGCPRRSRRPRRSGSATPVMRRRCLERALRGCDAGAARIDRHGRAQRPRERLEGGLGDVVVVAARRRTGGASRRRSARTSSSTCSTSWVESAPIRSPRNGRSSTAYGRPDRSSAHARERLVHGHRARRRSGRCRRGRRAPRRCASPSDERHVLDRVVLVDLAGRPSRLDLEVDQRVVRRATSAGGRRSRPRSRMSASPVPSRSTRDPDAASRASSARGRSARRGRGHAGPPVDASSRAPRAGRSASGVRTVKRRCPRSGLRGPERARHDARRAAGARSRPRPPRRLPMRQQQEVGDARVAGAARRRRGRRRATPARRRSPRRWRARAPGGAGRAAPDGGRDRRRCCRAAGGARGARWSAARRRRSRRGSPAARTPSTACARR